MLSSLPGRLTDHLALGLLTGSVPRDVVDGATAAHGRGAKGRGGALPPHVMVYFAMAMALFAEDDYEGVLAHLSETLSRWGCWERSWAPPTSGGITQARARLGFEPVREVFDRVAVPVADALTRGAWCAGLRLVSIDGMVFDLPDTPANAKEFGYPSGGAFPQARVVTLTESGSHCSLGVHIGPVAGKGTGERTAARELFALLEPDMLLAADRGFCSFDAWRQAELRGPGRILRSKHPDMVRQEIYGFLLTHYAIAALICRATETDTDPDRAKFARTARLARRRITDPAAFPP